jgi:Leucine-rich repeat (LRR) protein
VLNLSGNLIKDFKVSLSSLKELNLSFNLVEKVETIQKLNLLCPNLKVLFLKGNPIAKVLGEKFLK